MTNPLQAYTHKHGEAWKALRRILRRDFVEERIELLVPTLYDLCCLFLVERENVFVRRTNRLRDEEEGIGKKESDEIKKSKAQRTRQSTDPRRRSKSCCDASQHSRDREHRRASDEDDHHDDHAEDDIHDENEDNIDHGDEEQEAEEREMRKWERVLPLDIKEKLRLDYKRCGNPSCNRMGFFFGEGRVKRRFVERGRLLAEQREREEARRCREDLDFVVGRPSRMRLHMSADSTNDIAGRPFPFVGVESKWVCWGCRYENSGLLFTCALCREDRGSNTTSTLSLLPSHNVGHGSLPSSASSSSSSTSSSSLTLALPSIPAPRGNAEGEKAREREMRRRDRLLRRTRNMVIEGEEEMDDEEEEGEEENENSQCSLEAARQEGKHKEAEEEESIPSSPCTPSCSLSGELSVRRRPSGVERAEEEEEEKQRRYQRAEVKAELTLSFCSPDCAAVLGRFLVRCTPKSRDGKRARTYSHSQPPGAQVTLPRPRTRRMGVFGAHHG
jgi:hypothetical protein